MRILLVDDDFDIIEELKEWLIDSGHFVESVFSGPEALDHLAFGQYDLIVLDYYLPGKGGKEVCREFRAKGGRTPIVMLTGNAAFEFKDECIQAGANTFLEKPFPLDEFDKILSSCNFVSVPGHLSSLA